MKGQLTLDDAITIFEHIESMARKLQKTRNPLEIARDTIMWVASAVHIPVEPEPQDLTNDQTKYKEFYRAVADERNASLGTSPPGRNVRTIPFNMRRVGGMISLFRFARRNAQGGFRDVQIITARLEKRGWDEHDIRDYPEWEPPGPRFRRL